MIPVRLRQKLRFPPCLAQKIALWWTATRVIANPRFTNVVSYCTKFGAILAGTAALHPPFFAANPALR